MQEQVRKNHTLILENRGSLTVSGLTDIDRFDEREIVIFTEQGELSITGRELHIRSISIEQGDLTVEGEIWGLLYGDKDKRAPLTALGRLFR
ncbi:MAG: YabP/YqfC family sporulation protein [Oscillospiraceae bacterium]|nr:YabP/YqfC family sporulation protein [Oscillospiraceae bacterium]